MLVALAIPLLALVVTAAREPPYCNQDVYGVVYETLDKYELELQLPYRHKAGSPLVYDLTKYNYPCNPRYTKPGSPSHEGTLLLGCTDPVFGAEKLKVVLSDLTHAHVYLPPYRRSEQLSVVATVYCNVNGSPVE